MKALLLKSSIGADHERRRLEIAMQWDNMEKQLCSGEDELWYFLTRESPERYPTRIEFLFDLMARKDPCERDEYFTFFYFEKQLSRESVEQLWEAIVNNFLRLKEWFEDKEFYHLIGYLISSGSATMSEIHSILHQDGVLEVLHQLWRHPNSLLGREGPRSLSRCHQSYSKTIS